MTPTMTPTVIDENENRIVSRQPVTAGG